MIESATGAGSDSAKHAERARCFQSTLEDVVAFSRTPEFQATLNEMWALPAALRYEFVELVFLDRAELARRAITLPDGMDIQRSWFADERPTLFCVTKKLPPGMGWKVATVTIDNPIEENSQAYWEPDMAEA